MMTEHEFTVLLRFHAQAGIVSLVCFCKELFKTIQQLENTKKKQAKNAYKGISKMTKPTKEEVRMLRKIDKTLALVQSELEEVAKLYVKLAERAEDKED